MNWKAAKTSAALSALFLVVYGGCNWFTSLRHDVPSFYFSWERHIPFVPLLIVPYMSIDLFFIAAPFLCSDDTERRTFAQRIAAAILIAGCCFLLFPLRFAFERPYVDGWLGLVFNNFRNLDRPFNEFPSLHITLWLILADLYSRHTRAPLNAALAVWFILIGVSTLLTYQHHFVDILGGIALAALCFYFFPDPRSRLPVTPNRRVGLYYAAASLVAIAAALFLRHWGWLLLWPALSLAIIAFSYFGAGPGIFRKSSGRISRSASVLLLPVLLAQRLSLIYYARRAQPWDQLTPNLWIGRQLSSRRARHAVAAGVTAVLDLTCEFSEAIPFRQIAYHQLPILDLTAPTAAQLEEGAAFIRRHSSGIVYVHCKAGFSRTAAMAGAYLLSTGLCPDSASVLATLRSARPAIIIRPEAMAILTTFAHKNCTPARSPADH